MKIAWSILIGLFLLPGAAYAAGSEHAFGQAAGNCGGKWPLPDTGQTVHYSTAPGDDSDYRPAAVQPGYKDNGDGTTTDNITRLMWVKDPNAAGIGGTYTWENALIACEGLTYATYTDWRLPNGKELQSIVDYSRQSPSINPTYFLNTQSSYYWSSTTYVPSTTFALLVYFNDGIMTNFTNKISMYYVRCVRGGP